MFSKAALESPDFDIDPVHDGRHALPDVPTARESIPYLVALPEHRIAIIAYFWATRGSMAGAALAVFGQGAGTGVQIRIPDQPVSPEMNFDDWRLGGLSIRQDLAFDKAQVRWASPEVSFEFDFEAFHPPYAYASDPRGCPPYLALDRIEQAGRVRGRLAYGGHTIEFDATGHRDHSWGTRDWIPFQHHEWFLGQVGADIAVHFLRYQGLGREHLRGYVYKDGRMSRVVKLDLDIRFDNQYCQTGYAAVLLDAAGRRTKVEAEVFGVYGLVPDPSICLNESGAAARIDGRAGAAWLEVGWPAQYLQYIRSQAYV
ncbi:MAG: hypothetical protein ISP45_01750 [Reyranella sp.]|nr:hypothetical protein [Reyranella sp.]